MIHPVLPSYAKSWFKFPAGEAAVGVVRFDGHPGLDGKSGDEHF